MVLCFCTVLHCIVLHRTVDVQTVGGVPATQTAGVLEVGVCKERTYRINIIIVLINLIRHFARWLGQFVSMAVALGQAVWALLRV